MKLIMTDNGGFERQLQRLTNRTPQMFSEVLEAGMAELFPKVKNYLEQALSQSKKPKQTGQMKGALGYTSAKKNKRGEWNIKAGFGEPRKDEKLSNGMLGGLEEYGSSHNKRPPRPFIKIAMAISESDVIGAMSKVVDDYLIGGR
ncbi:hypothetical protein FACS1894188_03830 [Clostridia bacterium]|nr:hypothetical protein FACS1894188_03830 [Clostridia bacterium]